MCRKSDFRLPSPCKWDLHSSRMLRSVNRYLPTFRDSLSAPYSRIKQSKKNCVTLEDVTDWLSRNVGRYLCTLHNIPEERTCMGMLFNDAVNFRSYRVLVKDKWNVDTPVDDTDSARKKYWKRNLSRLQFILRKSHVHWPVKNSRPVHLAGDWLPEPTNLPEYLRIIPEDCQDCVPWQRPRIEDKISHNIRTELQHFNSPEAGWCCVGHPVHLNCTCTANSGLRVGKDPKFMFALGSEIS
jgi:hypothetical protein